MITLHNKDREMLTSDSVIARVPHWVAAQDDGAPALVTIPNIELLEVGEDWATSTGTFTWSVDHLQSAIASQDDPMVRTPVIKFGHTDPRFDGQPSVGRVQNMRLTNNDQTLVGDLIGVPAWLAECMASAYPRRSIEGFFDYPTRTGNVWPFALTGVALLGAAYPAIDCLEDVQALFGKEPPVLVEPNDATGVEAAGNAVVAVRLADRHLLRAPQDVPTPAGRTYADPPSLPVAAAADGPQHVQADVSVDDVRMAFYSGPGAEPGRYWWWIREVRVDPAECIVDDDEGHLFRVAYSIGAGDGEGAVEFAEPQQVRIQYVDVAAAGQTIVKRFGNPVAAGRPRVRAANEPAQPTQEETDVQLSEEELRALGLEPGATDEEIHTALVAKLTAPPPTGETEPPAPETPLETPPAEPPASETSAVPTATVPEGMVLVDEATLNDMREAAAATRRIVEERAEQDRNMVLDGAIRAGKFPLSRREHYEKLLLSDPEGGKQMIASLGEGLVPVQERGRQGGETDPEVAASAYPEEWKPQVAAAQRASRGSRIKVASD